MSCFMVRFATWHTMSSLFFFFLNSEMIHYCGALRAVGQTTFWTLTKLHLLYTWCCIVFESKTTKQKQRAKKRGRRKKKDPRLITSVDRYESSASMAWADKVALQIPGWFCIANVAMALCPCSDTLCNRVHYYATEICWQTYKRCIKTLCNTN